MTPIRQDEVLILGVGNPLLGDDGAGIRAVELLEKYNLPEHVTVQEIGTPGWGLGAWFEGWSNVILIDAVQMGQKPGDWQRLILDQVRLLWQESAFSLHQPDLASGLLLAQELGLLPNNLVIYGIEPEDLSLGNGLSFQVDVHLPQLVQKIVDDVRRGQI